MSFERSPEPGSPTDPDVATDPDNPTSPNIPNGHWFGYTRQQETDWDPNAAAVILCPFALTLRDLRTSACTDIHTTTSYGMFVLAAALLHEFLHWEYLTAGALNGAYIGDWNDPVQTPPEGQTAIQPPNGYGPFNCMTINALHNPLLNADNYVWFALEAYWRETCPGYLPGPALGPSEIDAGAK